MKKISNDGSPTIDCRRTKENIAKQEEIISGSAVALKSFHLRCEDTKKNLRKLSIGGYKSERFTSS